jgi:hypothetical protein
VHPVEDDQVRKLLDPLQSVTEFRMNVNLPYVQRGLLYDATGTFGRDQSFQEPLTYGVAWGKRGVLAGGFPWTEASTGMHSRSFSRTQWLDEVDWETRLQIHTT